MTALSSAAVTPNWFASVMGTGIVGVAATSLPWHVPGLHAAAVVVWMLAAVLLAALLAATALQWHRHPALARGHHRHPVLSHFWGAAPMAMLTVGAGALLLGRDVIGLRAALTVDWTLWTLGTVSGLVTTVAVPWLVHRHHGIARADVRAYWLMPVVPPTVSASTGALLVPHVSGHAGQVALLVTCYGLLLLSIAASALVIPSAVRNIVRGGVGAPTLVPTLFIVLGPLGQSVTAAGLLGVASGPVLDDGTAHLMRVLGLTYGIPVWSLAIVWAAFAVRATLRVAHGPGLPFGLPWWSFTFPVGTVVTGTSGLATHLDADPLRVAAALGYIVLVAAWLVVAVRTARAVARDGLLAPPAVLAAA